MKSNQTLGGQHLGPLVLEEVLGNVGEASLRGIPHPQFHEYKRRFQIHGIESLERAAPIPKSHPHDRAAGGRGQDPELSLAHPAWGCNRLSVMLEIEGTYVSSTTARRGTASLSVSTGWSWKSSSARPSGTKLYESV